MLTALSKATASTILRPSRYQQIFIPQLYSSRSASTSCCQVTASPLLLNSVRGGQTTNYNNSSVLHRPASTSGHNRLLLELTLLSSALLLSTTAANNNTPSSHCSTNDKSDQNSQDEDFISKIQAKINQHSPSSTLSTLLLTSTNDLLTTISTNAQSALDSGIPTHLSYGFVAGYLSGFTLKKIGRLASVTFGMGFVAMQTLAYYGYIDVNHEDMKKKVEGALDRNGDGRVDVEDLKLVLDEVQSVVGFGLDDDGKGEGRKEEEQVKAVAGGGGFGMGFLGGLRSG